MLFPFSKERTFEKANQVITIEKIELDVDVPAARFKMPPANR